MCMCVCLHVSVNHMHAELIEARRGHQSPRNCKSIQSSLKTVSPISQFSF